MVIHSTRFKKKYGFVFEGYIKCSFQSRVRVCSYVLSKREKRTRERRSGKKQAQEQNTCQFFIFVCQSKKKELHFEQQQELRLERERREVCFFKLKKYKKIIFSFSRSVCVCHLPSVFSIPPISPSVKQKSIFGSFMRLV